MFLLSRLMVSLILTCTLMTGGASAQGFFDHPLIGKAAPDFILDTLSASSVHFSDLSKGKKTILFFWATWCPHCREQIKALKAQAPHLAKEGVTLLMVDIGEDPTTVRKFLADNKYDFPVFLDVNSYVSEMYQVFGVPSLFLIGQDGKIRDMQNGFPDDFDKILK